jgi:2-amino-4-hydroxy-6-hydroxymethyldihydropteridine diphosphokinase
MSGTDPATAVAYLGLGANLGDAVSALRAALVRIEALPTTRLLRASRRYRTPAWGVTDQPDFVNAVAAVETALAPRELLDALLAIERDFGRTRAADGSDRWGPRSLDLDILLYADRRLDQPGLHVPHPQLHRRAFVLVPLLEIAPELVVPGQGAVRDLVAAVDGGGIEALVDH